MSEGAAVEVTENESERRFEAHVDGELAGFAEYELDGHTIVFHHTVVEPHLRHRGIAGQLVGGALDTIRDRGGLRVIPRCSYVKSFIDDHPDYAEVLSPPL